MAILRSGLILAGGYALKIRRVLFAQTKEQVKRGELSQQEVARAAGQLNSALYELLVEELRLNKGDVVRISLEYEIKDGTVHWKMDSLVVEVWKKVDDEFVADKVSKLKSKTVAGEG
ncbi:MAG: DUF2258 domain-containing protein [Acidilobaceae archaeon]|nr:DUF2258 domain-containing protein [Acidilobaceae archaeon]MCX8165887.1 DUF2258 domain-containing protein [Acidilobaceae archaeon]MDW7974529.1 DUF2258 domain-containing protein [Sulfolobales archaeon]